MEVTLGRDTFRPGEGERSMTGPSARRHETEGSWECRRDTSWLTTVSNYITSASRSHGKDR